MFVITLTMSPALILFVEENKDALYHSFFSLMSCIFVVCCWLSKWLWLHQHVFILVLSQFSLYHRVNSVCVGHTWAMMWVWNDIHTLKNSALACILTHYPGNLLVQFRNIVIYFGHLEVSLRLISRTLPDLHRVHHYKSNMLCRSVQTCRTFYRFLNLDLTVSSDTNHVQLKYNKMSLSFCILFICMYSFL